MILEVRNLSHLVDDEKIFTDFNFYIREKGCYLIQSVQANKLNTLADLICGYQKIQQGEIILQGVPANFLNPIYKTKSLLLNHNSKLDSYLDIFEGLYFWARLHYAENLNIQKIVADLLDRFSVYDLSTKNVNQLSNQDFLKILLLRSCLGHHRLVVFNQIAFTLIQDFSWIQKLIDTLLNKEKTLLFLNSEFQSILDINYFYQWRFEDNKLHDFSF